MSSVKEQTREEFEAEFKAIFDQKPVTLPDGAESLSPGVWALREQNRVLKAGTVKMAEAEAMRFVAAKTTIPVPEVYESYERDGNGYIFMSRIEGELLGDVWKYMNEEQQRSVISQMRDFVNQLSSLEGDFYGSLWHQPCEDVWFCHWPFKQITPKYGPYYSRKEYNDGLILALANSTPSGTVEGLEELVERIAADNDEKMVFSHGDLHTLNILVDQSTSRITGVIDWGGAGFSIPGRDYYEARARSGPATWKSALDDIFPESAQVHFELLHETDQTMRKWTLI